MEDTKELLKLFREYTRIMENEAMFKPACKRFATRPYDIYRATKYLAEIAKASVLLRGWCSIFNLASNKIVAYESDGAHTNLMMAMVDRALVAVYGPNYEGCTKATEGYTYREIMEAVRLHDLPENSFGDWVDNGERDGELKLKLENGYYNQFQGNYTEDEGAFISKVRQIIDEMNEKEHPFSIGRLLYAADKYSAVIIALSYDAKTKQAEEYEDENVLAEISVPAMHRSFLLASKRDHDEMDLCDYEAEGYSKASEMFTTDILHIRDLNQYDDTGFFTGVIVMQTLMVNGRWYNWREKDYEEKRAKQPTSS